MKEKKKQKKKQKKKEKKKEKRKERDILRWKPRPVDRIHFTWTPPPLAFHGLSLPAATGNIPPVTRSFCFCFLSIFFFVFFSFFFFLFLWFILIFFFVCVEDEMIRKIGWLFLELIHRLIQWVKLMADTVAPSWFNLRIVWLQRSTSGLPRVYQESTSGQIKVIWSKYFILFQDIVINWRHFDS